MAQPALTEVGAEVSVDIEGAEHIFSSAGNDEADIDAAYHYTDHRLRDE